jgi:hypothetical protein
VTNEPLRAAPAFILSSIRSGSTLLRCLLDGHPEICAPHELHFRYLKAESASPYLDLALRELQLQPAELRWILWERLYEIVLARSGKRLLVDKSPSNLWVWRDLQGHWPQARFIMLQRDPAAIARSIVEAGDGRSEAEAVRLIADTVSAFNEALEVLPSPYLVRYENLVGSPMETLDGICRYLQVAYDPQMVEFGRIERSFRYGIGDWGGRIQSGVMHAARTERLHPQSYPGLEDACQAWGY